MGLLEHKSVKIKLNNGTAWIARKTIEVSVSTVRI